MNDSRNRASVQEVDIIAPRNEVQSAVALNYLLALKTA